MSGKEVPNVTTEQLVYANMVSIEALVDVLVKKGICTKDDILNSLKDVKKRQDEFVTDFTSSLKPE